jgi:hypothetical protein
MKNNIWCEKNNYIIVCDSINCRRLSGSKINNIFNKKKSYKDSQILVSDINNNIKQLEEIFLHNIECKNFWRQY